MDYMKFDNKRTVAVRIVQAVIKDKRSLNSIKTVDRLINFTQPLLADDAEPGAKEDPYEFAESQQNISQLIHLVYHSTSVDMYFELLNKFRRVFIKGGNQRMKFTIPALVFALIRLSVIVNTRTCNPELEQQMYLYSTEPHMAMGGGQDQLGEESKMDTMQEPEEDEISQLPASAKCTQKKIFKTIIDLLNLIQATYPELTLRLNLQAVQAVNNLNQNEQQELEDLAYEFMTNAYSIFEEEISETEQKVPALNLITTTLYTLQCFNQDNFETLVSNAVSYSGKLLKKNMQCEATTLASHLFYCAFNKNGTKVMDLLRKSLKTSEVCMTKPENLYLLVNILNTYLYYRTINAEFMSDEDICTLCSFIKETVDEIEEFNEPAKQALKALQNCRASIA